MMPGSTLLITCDPGFCDDLLLPESPFTTATANYTVETNYQSPQTSAQPFTEQKLDGYPDCDRNEYVTAWTSGIPAFGPVHQLDNLLVQSVTSATSVFKKISETASTPAFVFASYARPGSTQFGNTVVLATGIQFRVRDYLFQGFSSSGTSNEPAFVTTSYDVHTSCCDSLDAPSINEFESATPGPSTGRTPSVTSNFETLRWLPVAVNSIPGMNLVLTAVSGVANAPWDIKVKSGSIVMKNRAGISRSYAGSLTTAKNAINADGFFIATIPANITTTGPNVALVTDLQDHRVVGIQRIACTTSLPIAHRGAELMPSSVGSGYNGFTLQPGFTDDLAGLTDLLSSTWHAKSNVFVGTLAGKFYLTDEFDTLVTDPSPPAFSITPGSSDQTFTFSAAMAPGNVFNQTNGSSLVDTHCSVPCGSALICCGCLYELTSAACTIEDLLFPEGFCDNISSFPITRVPQKCDGSPFPVECDPSAGESPCWCERGSFIVVDEVLGDQVVTQTLTGTFVIT